MEANNDSAIQFELRSERLAKENTDLRAQLAEAQKERNDYRRLAQQAKADREEELLGVIWEAKEELGCIPGNAPKGLLQVCQEVMQQLAEAKQALAEARKDKERLNRLETQKGTDFEWFLQRHDNGGYIAQTIRIGYYSHDKKYPTVRDAIDDIPSEGL